MSNVLRSTTFALHVDVGNGVQDIKTFTRAVTDADKTAEMLSESIEGVTRATISNANPTRNATQQARLNITAMEQANRAYERQSEFLRNQIELMGKSAEEQYVLSQVQALGRNATAEQIQNTASLAQQYYQLNNASGQAASGAGRVGFAFQNAGYQIQDATVQLQLGTDAFVVMSQQLPQFLGMFGAAGAIAGAAVAIGGALAPSIIQMFDESAGAAERYAQKMETVNSVLQTNNYSVEGLSNSYRDLYQVNEALANLQLEIANIQAIQAQEDSIRSMASNMKLLENNAVTLRRNGVVENLGITQEDYRTILNASRAMDGTVESARAFQQALEGIDMSNATAEFVEFTDGIIKAGVNIEKSAASVKALSTTLSEGGVGATAEYITATKELNEDLDDQINKLRMSEEAYRRYTLEKRLSKVSTDEERVSIQGKINTILSLEAAQRAAEESQNRTNEQIRENIALFESQRDAMEQLRNEANPERNIWQSYNEDATLLQEMLNQERITVEEHAIQMEALTQRRNRAIEGLRSTPISLNELFGQMNDAILTGNTQAMNAAAEGINNYMGAFGQVSSMSQGVFDTMINGSEQVAQASENMNGIQKAMFFTTRAIAAAEAVVNGILLGTKLAAMAPNPVTASAMIATGTGIGSAAAGAIMGTTFAGLFDNGGRIGGNEHGIVAEHGAELVNGALVMGAASVTSRKDTAELLGGKGMTVEIFNYSNGTVQTQQIDENRVRVIVGEEFAKKGDKWVSDNLSKSGSRSQKSISSNFNVSRKY